MQCGPGIPQQASSSFGFMVSTEVGAVTEAPCLVRPSLSGSSMRDSECVTGSARNVNLSLGAQRLLAGHRPILFSVAGVFGVGVSGEQIALALGTIALVDPVESDRIGDYKMYIFSPADSLEETANA